jgi:hypothetical protein
VTDEEQLTEAEMPNAADAKAVRKRQTKAQRQSEEAAKFWAGVLATPTGRAEIWALLTDAHTFSTRFSCGPNGFPQTEATWYELGAQQWGLRFYQTLMIRDRAGVFAMHDQCDPRFAKPARAPRRGPQEENIDE